MEDGSRHRGSSGGMLFPAVVVIAAIVVVVVLYLRIDGSQWGQDLWRQPGQTLVKTGESAWKTVVRTAQQGNPFPRPTTICSKTNDNGTRVIETSSGELFVLADEVQYGGETLSSAEAYKVLKVGEAHWLSIRTMPVEDWNTHIVRIGKATLPLQPKACPS